MLRSMPWQRPWLALVLVALAAAPALAGYEPPGPAHRCPRPPSQLHPCTCEGGEVGIRVRCTNANLAMLGTALARLAAHREPVDELVLDKCHFVRLYGPLVQALQLRALEVRDTPLQSIGEETFLGSVNASLKELRLIHTRLDHFPSIALQPLDQLTDLVIEEHRIAALPNDAFTAGSAGSGAGARLLRLSISRGPLATVPPAALAPLRKLTRLALPHNAITALQRNQFKGLRDCEVLDLSHNGLSKIEAAHVGDLTRLKFLNISDNRIPDLPRSTFARNAVLLVLNVSGNALSKLDATTFRGVRNLRRLYLARNNIADVARGAFDSLTRVATIDLRGNRLKKVSYQMFQQLRFIEYIILAENNITEVESGAFKEVHLASIDMSSNMIKKIGVGAFINCANMSRLDLSRNRLSALPKRALDDLSYAGELDLAYNNLTDLSQVPMQNMTGLRVLNVSHNRIAVVPRNTFPKLYELHTVDLSYNNLSEIWPGVFQPLFSLRRLELSRNALKELRGGTLGALHTLLHLDLQHNELEEVARGALARLASLREISVRHNRLSKPFTPPPSLSHLDLAYNRFERLPERAVWPTMNALLSLDLSHNALSDEGLPRAAFANLLTLQTLNLANNQLTTAPKEAMQDLVSLQHIDLRGNGLERLERAALGRLPVVFSVDVSQNRLTNVSEKAFEGLLQLQALNLSHNALTTIPNGAFLGLVSLHTLDLSHNELDSLDNGTNSLLEDCLSLEHLNMSHNRVFVLTKRSLPASPWVPYRLSTLDLSHNRLPVLTKDILHGGHKLKALSLAGNLISELREGVLGNLTLLRDLDISMNLLKTLVPEVLGPPPALERLYVSRNRLSALPGAALAALPNLTLVDAAFNRLDSIPPELVPRVANGTTLIMEGNPLQCDCRLRPILRWASERGEAPPEWRSVVCSEPDHLAGVPVAAAPEPRLVCPGTPPPPPTLPPTLRAGRGKYRPPLPEDVGVEYDPAPDIRFKKVQRTSNGSVSAQWYVWTRDDVADFYLLVRPLGTSQPGSAPLAERDVPYNTRTASLDVPAESLASPLQVCVAARDSKGDLRPMRQKHQCRAIGNGAAGGSAATTSATAATAATAALCVAFVGIVKRCVWS